MNFSEAKKLGFFVGILFFVLHNGCSNPPPSKPAPYQPAETGDLSEQKADIAPTQPQNEADKEESSSDSAGSGEYSLNKIQFNLKEGETLEVILKFDKETEEETTFTWALTPSKSGNEQDFEALEGEFSVAEKVTEHTFKLLAVDDEDVEGTESFTIKFRRNEEPPKKALIELKDFFDVASSNLIAVADDHACGIMAGKAYCWGGNGTGELADGTSNSRAVARTVNMPNTGYTEIAAQADNSCGIKDGAAYCWGDGERLQIGDGTNNDRRQPTAVTNMDSAVTSIAVGLFHSCAVKAGAVMCWGQNDQGQLGDNSQADRSTAASVQTMDANVSDVATGAEHSCGVKQGALFCWGRNDQGQLGVGDNNRKLVATAVTTLASGVSKVDAFNHVTCALQGADLFCWGQNSRGQLGTGQAGGSQNTPQKVLSGVTDFAVGSEHVCAIADGKMKCWGRNASGQLGIGNRTDQLTPTDVTTPLSEPVLSIAAGTQSTCAAGATKMRCWGEGDGGRLGGGNGNDALDGIDVMFQ